MHPAIRPTLEHLGRRSRTAEAAESLAAGRATGARSGVAGEPVFTHQAEPPGHSVTAFPPSRKSAQTRAHKERPMPGVHCMGLGPFAGCPPLTCGDGLEPHFSSRVGRRSTASGRVPSRPLPPCARLVRHHQGGSPGMGAKSATRRRARKGPSAASGALDGVATVIPLTAARTRPWSRSTESTSTLPALSKRRALSAARSRIVRSRSHFNCNFADDQPGPGPPL
jgi:hypothetical protein